MSSVFHRILIGLVCLVMASGGVFVIQHADAASSTPVVYVATGENFPDALGAASAAAVHGGPVLLVTRTSIPSVTRAELTRLSPDKIVVAGGTAVVSDAVFDELKSFAPSVVRAAGADRYATAVEVSKSAFPVSSAFGGDVAALTAAVNALAERVGDLEAENATQSSHIAALEATLEGVTRNGSTLLLTGLNLQVVNGTGTTAGTPNGVGNIIIGYNEPATPVWRGYRAGSHFLVVGRQHAYSSFGGIVAGEGNTVTGASGTVLGGLSNAASGLWASVLGGTANTASGSSSSVSGGYGNTASSSESSVLGGFNQTVACTYCHHPN